MKNERQSNRGGGLLQLKQTTREYVPTLRYKLQDYYAAYAQLVTDQQGQFVLLNYHQ